MLALSQIATYTVALGIAAAIPGPGIVALVARSVSQGALAGFCMLAGLILGDLTYLTLAVFGLAILVAKFGALVTVIRWGSALYLAYLAWRFWTARHDSPNTGTATVDQRKALRGACLSGLTITLGNPKTIAFYLALVPLVIHLDTITWQSWGLALEPITITVLLAVGSLFILGAVQVRHWLGSQRAQRGLFRSAAVIMAGAAANILLR